MTQTKDPRGEREICIKWTHETQEIDGRWFGAGSVIVEMTRETGEVVKIVVEGENLSELSLRECIGTNEYIGLRTDCEWRFYDKTGQALFSMPWVKEMRIIGGDEDSIIMEMGDCIVRYGMDGKIRGIARRKT